MVFIRPVTLTDLDALLDLASLAGVGLTTLPKDRELLRKRILKSQRSMESLPDRPGGESYLFVLVDADAGKVSKVVGASGIVSKVGGFEPFYAYRIEKIPLHSDVLKVNKDIATLQLVREHDGPAEVGSLFLSPDYRHTDNGRFLQLVRFLFVAEHREAFEPLVVSEMRGMIDDQGRSAFWDAVGRHFFEIEFPEADHLSVVNKKFIADLMPTYPLYIPLLPEGARKAIGQVHEQSRAALKNLQSEGFTFNGMVDIFDAGACISCQRDQIRTVRECRAARIEAISEQPLKSVKYMIANVAKEFRACLGCVEPAGQGSVKIEAACARLLGVEVGQTICYSPLRPATATEAKA